jgi:hypothetical protein
MDPSASREAQKRRNAMELSATSKLKAGRAADHLHVASSMVAHDTGYAV